MLPSTPGQCPPQWLESPYGCDAKRNASHAARQPMAGMPGVPHRVAARVAGVPHHMAGMPAHMAGVPAHMAGMPAHMAGMQPHMAGMPLVGAQHGQGKQWQLQHLTPGSRVKQSLEAQGSTPKRQQQRQPQHQQQRQPQHQHHLCLWLLSQHQHRQTKLSLIHI